MICVLKEMYQKQLELDNEIAKNHNISYEETKDKRLLALLVELGEFANATRTFKFWSFKPRESKERVKTAIKNSGFNLNSRKIVVNLAPAAKRKEGSIFDLPIAIGILADLGEIEDDLLDKKAFIGELSLDGKINRVNGLCSNSCEC